MRHPARSLLPRANPFHLALLAQALQGLYKEHSRGAETVLGRSAKAALEDWGQLDGKNYVRRARHALARASSWLGAL